jgi:hypothetical protein
VADARQEMGENVCTIDHSAVSRPAADPAAAGLSIMRIPPRGSAQKKIAYPIAQGRRRGQMMVMGRFGYSYKAPDPAWEKGKNSEAAAAWQTIADADMFWIRGR